MRIKLVALGIAAMGLLGACLPGGGGVFTTFAFDHEDNDTEATAQLAGTLVPGQVVLISGTVAQGDWDWFEIALPPGQHRFEIQCKPILGSNPFVFIDLYDPNADFFDGTKCIDGWYQTAVNYGSSSVIVNVGLQTSPFRPPVEYEARIRLLD